MNSYVWSIIVGCSVVTWLPRVIPFILTKKLQFPPNLIKFLAYIPICILTALVFQSMLEVQNNGFPKIKTLEAIASVPTFLVAVKTKDLMKTVIVGIITMAIFRLI
jgi:branched-subunit amino acid transport protein